MPNNVILRFNIVITNIYLIINLKTFEKCHTCVVLWHKVYHACVCVTYMYIIIVKWH